MTHNGNMTLKKRDTRPTRAPIDNVNERKLAVKIN